MLLPIKATDKRRDLLCALLSGRPRAWKWSHQLIECDSIDNRTPYSAQEKDRGGGGGMLTGVLIRENERENIEVK